MNSFVTFAQESGGNPLGLIILLLPIAAIIFLTVVPQRRQRRQQAELMSAIDVGDEVVTIGGIHGIVNHIEDDVMHLEVDDDVVIRVGRGAVARRVGDPDPSDPKNKPGLLSSLMGGGAAASAKGAGADGGAGDDGDAGDGDGAGDSSDDGGDSSDTDRS